MKPSCAIRRLCLLCALAPVLALAQDADRQFYRDGQAALDSLQWQKALDSFKKLSHEGAELDGALYWKAFALDRMGQRKEALAALDELRTSYPGSGWLGDAQTLETAIVGNPGSNVPPRKEPDTDARLRALADLARTDPGHAAAAFRDAALEPNLPGVRQRSVYDISRETSPEAHELLMQVARGVSNPDPANLRPKPARQVRTQSASGTLRVGGRRPQEPGPGHPIG